MKTQEKEQDHSIEAMQNPKGFFELLFTIDQRTKVTEKYDTAAKELLKILYYIAHNRLK